MLRTSAFVALTVPASQPTMNYGWLESNTALREYQRMEPSVVELAIGAARPVADLASGGEVDTFHFDVTTAATYIMSTEGPTDTVLTLHGPTDPGAVLSWDDDRGRGLNARIVRKLQPGSYWLSVRHKQAAGTGQYTIGIKKRVDPAQWRVHLLGNADQGHFPSGSCSTMTEAGWKTPRAITRCAGECARGYRRGGPRPAIAPPRPSARCRASS